MDLAALRRLLFVERKQVVIVSSADILHVCVPLLIRFLPCLALLSLRTRGCRLDGLLLLDHDHLVLLHDLDLSELGQEVLAFDVVRRPVDEDVGDRRRLNAVEKLLSPYPAPCPLSALNLHLTRLRRGVALRHHSWREKCLLCRVRIASLVQRAARLL